MIVSTLSKKKKLKDVTELTDFQTNKSMVVYFTIDWLVVLGLTAL